MSRLVFEQTNGCHNLVKLTNKINHHNRCGALQLSKMSSQGWWNMVIIANVAANFCSAGSGQ